MFSFAAKSGVRVVYSLRLLNGDLANEVQVAQYVWDHYKEYLVIDCFASATSPTGIPINGPTRRSTTPLISRQMEEIRRSGHGRHSRGQIHGTEHRFQLSVSGAKDTNYKEILGR